jgi:hypothetical protein
MEPRVGSDESPTNVVNKKIQKWPSNNCDANDDGDRLAACMDDEG